ncbi:MAG: SDR family oxidoreductase [Sedimentisphaerales bacterium]|nr:SDR family oxidoreductase [Sedimentisphaerales bacterium]
MDKTLERLIEISQAIGSDANLMQGGGGMILGKSGNGRYMYVRAGDTNLKDIIILQDRLHVQASELISVLDEQKLSKPGEDKREATFVIHLSPTVVGAFVNAKGGKAEIEKLFRDEKYPPVWIDYADPGTARVKKSTTAVRQYAKQHGAKPSVMFLEKQGLLVTASSGAKALQLLRKVVKKCKSRLKPLKAVKAKSIKAKLIDSDELSENKLAIRRACFATTGEYAPVGFVSNDVVRGFSRRKDAGKLLGAGALDSNELTCTGGAPIWLEKVDSLTIERKLRAKASKGQKPARAFLVKGIGLFVVGDTRNDRKVEEVAVGSLMVRNWAAGLDGVNALTRRQAAFIEKNGAQKSVGRKMGDQIAGGDLKNNIAVVTGAGSGLGRSIAVGMAQAGAMVAVADIDSGAAQETVDLIVKEMPHAAAMVVSCNVTDEKSVIQAFEGILAEWGGLDIVVNAAGVAPAYALVDLPVDKWRFALEVNLTGYFLMAKTAARIMIRQGMGGSIINISSKSGIDASKNNTPYNATKAGELHMARGWAMELGEHGIRVNCVCPGNVFEGSKIWNPKYIRECARKYGILPEEVIPYYTGKTILKREIKGQDIADAVVFLCSDKARTITGQIIIADSGQAMVR